MERRLSRWQISGPLRSKLLKFEVLETDSSPSLENLYQLSGGFEDHNCHRSMTNPQVGCRVRPKRHGALFITAAASDKISAPASRKSSSENSAFTPAPAWAAPQATTGHHQGQVGGPKGWMLHGTSIEPYYSTILAPEAKHYSDPDPWVNMCFMWCQLL